MQHDRRPDASERREADLDDAELAQRRRVRAKAERMGGRLNDIALDLSLIPAVAKSGLPQILLAEVDRMHMAFTLDPPDLDAVELAMDRIDLFAEAMNSSFSAVRVEDPGEARAYVQTSLLRIREPKVAELLTGVRRGRLRSRSPVPVDLDARAVLVA